NTYIAFTLGIALLSGIYLILNSGPLTIYLLGAGLFFVIFYTWPLKYIGLGEPAVILVWGPLMIGGTYYVTTGNQWSWDVVGIAMAYALGPTTVLFGKHTDKLREDKKKKVYTLPVILGEKFSRYSTIGLWIAQYLIIGYLVWQGAFGIPVLLILLALPKLVWAMKIFGKPRPTEEPEELEKGVWPLYLSAHAFQYNRKFSLLFLLGLIVDLILNKTGVL
ncbi:MAG: prenyltransferase, partial [Bacteroidota bacterium]